MSNIEVVVRCRGRTERETAARSQVVVDLASETYSKVQATVTVGRKSGELSQKIVNSSDAKTYTFDAVYGPLADQELIFKKSVMPLFSDFLHGFNATVLAYGQTGTGKTYTMYGKSDFELRDDGITEKSGIIPRVLNELFRKLDGEKEDFLVKCSFIELYNENLKDLLNDDPEPSKQTLKIFDSKKNSNTILIQNLKEVFVGDQKSGFELLRKGLSKRKVASTKLNDVSSRSHTIFTINLFRKSANHEELIRHSKINLVDLAGAENISKSGSMNLRAKEAASINQSLLTLGRVITSLSDKSTRTSPNLNHIPYRESKLTRLLQDSIGGRTKTLLISTISPAKINLEETSSTLEYSLKVKNIENKPQLGQDFNLIMRKVLMKDLSNEIIRLNNDLIATRSKNGIFMNEANYHNLMEESMSNRNEINELKAKNTRLETKLTVCEEKIRSSEINEAILHEDLKKRDSRNRHLDDKIERANRNVTDSLSLLGQLKQKLQNSSVASASIGKLNESLVQKLDALKNSFQQQTETIEQDIQASILVKIPSMLQELLKDLSHTDKSFANYKRHQQEIVNRLDDLNNELNSFMLNKVLKEFNLDEAIDKYVEDKVASRIEEHKAQLMSKLCNVVGNEYQNIAGLFKTSMTQFCDGVVDSEVGKVNKYMNEWNIKFNSTKRMLDDNLWKYEDDMKQLDGCQTRVQQTSSNVVAVVDQVLGSNLSSLNKSFQMGHQQISEVLPQLAQYNRQNLDTSVSEEISGISSHLHSITTKSPLKAVDLNFTEQSPHNPPKKTVLSKATGLHGKENFAGDAKRRKID